MVDAEQALRLERARVGRLATASRDGRPHCVPVCFAWTGSEALIALDEKPKSVEVRALRRVRNVLENPQATLLVDHYEEDWGRLWFLMLESAAGVGPLSTAELRLLREKYPQYRQMRLEEAIRLQPRRVVAWAG